MPPVSAVPPTPPPAKKSSWNQLRRKADSIASLVVFLTFLVAVGGVIGYYYSKSRQPVTTTPKTTISTLSSAEIAKLGQIGTDLGASGQTLNIGANALFRGKIDVSGDLSIGGHLNANGPVTLSQLNITGTTAATGLNVGSNLNVTGNTTLQQGLSVGQLATFASGINVGGNASFNALNAGTLAVRTISISGPLTIGHLSTQGPVPGMVAGTAVGGGGTTSISGNDTAGTVNLSTGSAPPAGVLATVTFRAPYTSSVHVMLSPITGASASIPAYVTRTSGGFQIRVDSPPPAGSVLNFDYFVTQ